MTFQLRHGWEEGSRVNGAQLATCSHCGTLRVSLDVEGAPRVRFIRRADDGKETKPEEDPTARVTLVEPRCLSPEEHFRAPW